MVLLLLADGVFVPALITLLLGAGLMVGACILANGN
jgi:hypothetical protein